MNYFGKAFCSVALLGMAAGIPTAANAALVLRIDDLSTAGVDLEVTDDGDGFLSGLLFNVGDFSVVTGNAISKPLIGRPQLLHLDSLQVSGGAGTVTISLTDTDYLGAPGRFGSTFGGVLGVGASISGSSWISSSNVEFDTGTLISNGGFGSGGINFLGSDPYSLTISVTVTHTQNAASSFNYDIRVPEPAPLALVGLGLVVLAATRRRRS